MNTIKFQVINDGKTYDFDTGLKAYIFHIGIRFEHHNQYGIEALLHYVDLVSNCVLSDINSTVVADFAAFVSDHWEAIKDMDKYELLDFYYDDTE